MVETNCTDKPANMFTYGASPLHRQNCTHVHIQGFIYGVCVPSTCACPICHKRSNKAQPIHGSEYPLSRLSLFTGTATTALGNDDELQEQEQQHGGAGGGEGGEGGGVGWGRGAPAGLIGRGHGQAKGSLAVAEAGPACRPGGRWTPQSEACHSTGTEPCLSCYVRCPAQPSARSKGNLSTSRVIIPIDRRTILRSTSSTAGIWASQLQCFLAILQTLQNA